VSDGTRTRGRRDHNPELYQLSYAHQADCVANLAVPGHPQKAPGRWTGGPGRATTGCVVLVMLVDTREPHDEGRGSAREPWLVMMLEWVLPWPALIVWLCVASRMLDGWAGVASVFLAIGLTAWRGLRNLPTEGLDQQRQ
jgi:hypothetical protein